MLRNQFKLVLYELIHWDITPSSWLGVWFGKEYATSVDPVQVIPETVYRLQPKGKKSSFSAGRRTARLR